LTTGQFEDICQHGSVWNKKSEDCGESGIKWAASATFWRTICTYLRVLRSNVPVVIEKEEVLSP